MLEMAWGPSKILRFELKESTHERFISFDVKLFVAM